VCHFSVEHTATAITHTFVPHLAVGFTSMYYQKLMPLSVPIIFSSTETLRFGLVFLTLPYSVIKKWPYFGKFIISRVVLIVM